MFRSFYLAGFECATGYNMHGDWIDQIAATEHDRHVDADYARLEEVEIHAVREAIRWPLVDRAGRYDFATVEPFVDAARRHQFDVIWDLFHFGYPDDADPFDARFADRFADYCHAVASHLVRRMQGTLYVTPVNEPSFFAGAGGEVGRFAPHARGRGFELKVALARAALRGIDAIRDACPGARIVNVDPICRVVPGSDDPAAVEHARRFNEAWVWEFWDIVSGRLMPELGGSPEHLDIVGVNYYWTNQWELGREGVPLADDDPRRVSLADLVRAAWRRYGAEVIVTETSALGEAQARWVHALSLIAEELLDEGVHLGGICLYPILGMPEWHARDQWARMGLWDLEVEQDTLERKVCQSMLDALRAAQRRRPTRLDTRERRFRLARTGDAPLAVDGRLLWKSSRREPSYRLRLIRADRPHRLWIAAVRVRAGDVLLDHVHTATDLPELLDRLAAQTPARLAEQHGMRAETFGAEPRRAAERALAALRELAPVLELVPAERRGGAGRPPRLVAPRGRQ